MKESTCRKKGEDNHYEADIRRYPMRLLYGPDEVDKWIDYKLNRLQLHLYEK